MSAKQSRFARGGSESYYPNTKTKESGLTTLFCFWLGCRDSNPGNVRVRVWCLTAWRHPNIFNGLHYSKVLFRCQYLFSTFLIFLFIFSKFEFFLLYNPTKLWYNTRCSKHLPVAQLDSASDSDSEGRRFESFRAGQKTTSFDRSLSFFIQAAGLVWNHALACMQSP